MGKQTTVLVIGLALLAFATTQDTPVNFCDFNFGVQNPQLFQGFCSHQCSDPIFTFCPPQIFIPVGGIHADYCGKKNGTWANYTYVCQACNNGVQSFYYGHCSCAFVQCPTGYYCDKGNCFKSPTCDDITCKDGQVCQDAKCVDVPPPPPECTSDATCNADQVCDKTTGKCRIKTCADIVCEDPLDTCEFGYCFRKFDQFCSKTQPAILRHYCPLPLLTYQQCPTIYYVMPPEMTICGVTETGALIDYATDCQPCRIDRNYIMYYYKQPCSTVPKRCPSAFFYCDNGNCKVRDACTDIVCGTGQQCNNGICLPKPGYCLSDLNCPFGKICVDNACVVPVDPCDGVNCPTGKCYNGVCVDLCFDVYCPTGQQCVSGNCQPIILPPPTPDCVLNTDCSANQVCTDGKCVNINVPRCPAAPCNPGQFCTADGQCIDNTFGICFTSKQCPANQICLGNQCKQIECSSSSNSAQILLKCYGHPCVNNRCKNPYHP